MKFKCFVYILCLVLFVHSSTGIAFAVYDDMFYTEDKNKLEPKYVYMLYHKLAGIKPDFRSWIENTAEYQNAGKLRRLEIIKEKVGEMEANYRLLDVKDPIVITFGSKISPYSSRNKGFFIDNLQPDLFFSYEYMDKNFAIIPKDIENYQWFSIQEEDVEEVDIDLSKTNDVTLRIALLPKYADSKGPVKLAPNKKYWLILTKVINIEIWSKDNTQLLWRGKSASEDNKLLDLYK